MAIAAAGGKIHEKRIISGLFRRFSNLRQLNNKAIWLIEY
jgi:hypothetical protein